MKKIIFLIICIFYYSLSFSLEVKANTKEIKEEYLETIGELGNVEARNLVRKHLEKVEIEEVWGKTPTDYFSGKIRVNVGKEYAERKNSYIHETGHALDAALGEEYIGEDFFLSEFKNKMKDNIKKNYGNTKIIESYSEKNDTGKFGSEKYREVSDIINGITGGKIKYNYGHSQDYWRSGGIKVVGAEVFADLFVIYATNDEKQRKVIEELYPKLYSDFINLISGE
ncbi:MAG: hypothetical protein KAH04_01375 [Psychrilyobacter sp.]|nr:hypothetical protein [Psychrilyobacter sp.]